MKLLKGQIIYSYSNVVFMLLLIVMVWTTFNLKRWKEAEKTHKIIDWDVTSYYGYLPATFIHEDITLSFIDKDTINYSNKHQFWPETAPNGGKVIKTTMGMAFMYTPFFLMGHAVAHLSKYEPNGFSQPYEFFLVVSCLFYLFVGIWYLKKTLLQYYSEVVTSITMFVVLLGTNLYYYASTEPAMSHAYSFALVACLLYLTIKWHDSPTLKRAIIIGLIGGLIVLIRPVNILIFLFPLFLNVTSISTFKEKIQFFVSKWRHIVLIGFFAFLVILPQLMYWKYITGSWIFNSYVGERFYFGNPHLLEGLFSYRKGWLLYTPIMLFAIFGIFTFIKRHKQLLLPIMLFFAINTYVLYSWWSWWYGGGFGSRPMIDTYALMAIPLAGFFNWVMAKKVWVKGLYFTILISLVSLNLVQTLQKRRAIIHWDSMSKKAYWNVFLTLNMTQELWEKQEQYIIHPNYEKASNGEDEYSFEIF